MIHTEASDSDDIALVENQEDFQHEQSDDTFFEDDSDFAATNQGSDEEVSDVLIVPQGMKSLPSVFL